MSFMPPGRKIIGNRWVYNKKDDGTLRSRTVAQGFSQVPGQDFTDSHAPVITDLAFRLALIIRIMMKLRTGNSTLKQHFSTPTWMKKFICEYQMDMFDT
jgi:Reverse transcriptase (RNA-dependent DNA polymerase)